MRWLCSAALALVLAGPAARAAEVELSAGMTVVVQWIVAGEDAALPEGRTGEMSQSVDLEAEAALSPGVRAHVHIEASGGEGIAPCVAAFETPNRDAAGTAPADVTEAWLDGVLGAGVTVSAGKVDVSAVFDTNEVAGDETTQFLNGAFRNSSAAVFPEDNAAAAWLRLEPGRGPLEAVLGWAETDADWDLVFEDPYWFCELALRLGPGGERGRLRLYGWSAGGAYAPVLGGADADRTDGWGISADCRAGHGLTVFARYGRRDDALFETDSALSVGARLSGMPWMREGDVAGVALGVNFLGADYGASTTGTADESVLEAYYRAQASGGLGLTPGVQVIANAGGTRSDAAVILGLRAQATF